MRFALARWWDALRTSQQARALERRPLSDALWQSTLDALPFVQSLPINDLQRLRQLTRLFLDRKEFSGARGWIVDDAQAVMVALQACLPILHIAPPQRPDLALRWYDGFVGIVLHAGVVQARRSVQDAAGVVHSWQETLSGEAMQGGPLMLAWSEVAQSASHASVGYNVVIHEFIHVMDMQNGAPDGCPPMAPGAKALWLSVLQAEYAALCEQTQLWERFGALAPQKPLLDHYATQSIEEFFAVAAEAYFVRRPDFAQAHPRLLAQFDGFFRPERPQ